MLLHPQTLPSHIFPLSKRPLRKVPGVSFYSRVKVCHPLPGNLRSSLPSQRGRQTASWERVSGSTKPAGPAGLKAVLKLQEGSQLFWDSPARRKQRPPTTMWVCWWGGGPSCICVLIQAGHWGQRLDQDPNLAGAEGSSGAHGKWVVSGIQTLFAASAVCLWRG